MGAIKAIRIHPIGRHAHQVIKRRSLIPRVGNVSFAGRLAKACQGQDRGDDVPGNFSMPVGHDPFEKLIEFKGWPQSQSRVYVAEVARSLDTGAANANFNRFGDRLRRFGSVKERHARKRAFVDDASEVGPLALLARS